MREKPVYLMVPKKFVVAAVSVALVLFIGVLTSFQYANWVDQRSNQRLCGVVVLSNEAYAANPSTSVLRQQLAAAMAQLEKEYKCKKR